MQRRGDGGGGAGGRGQQGHARGRGVAGLRAVRRGETTLILASDWSRVWILTPDWLSGEAGVGDEDQPDREPEAEPDQPPLHVRADQGVTSSFES